MSIESFHAQLKTSTQPPLVRALESLRTAESTRTVFQNIGSSVLWPVWDGVQPTVTTKA